jgi:hypothetical protein
MATASIRNNRILFHVRFEVFTAVAMKNCVFWDVAPCRTAHAGSSLAGFCTLKMEAIRSSETPVHTRLHGTTSHKTPFFNIVSVQEKIKWNEG